MNEFEIRIKTLLEDAGIKATDEQLGSLAKSVENLNPKLGQIENAHKKTGQAAHEAGISHKEMHESVKLLAVGAGDALGPLGELAHFLGNPYILAAAGATLAIKMLIEQHQALHEQMVKNIETSREWAEASSQARTAAVREHASAVAAWADHVRHLGEETDRTAEAISRMNAQGAANLKGTEEIISANEALTEALIKNKIARGEISEPEGNAQLQAAKRAEQAQKDANEDAAKKAEINRNIHGIDQETSRKNAAGAAIPQLQNQEQELNHQINLTKERQKQAEQMAESKKKDYDEAKAEYDDKKRFVNSLPMQAGHDTPEERQKAFEGLYKSVVDKFKEAKDAYETPKAVAEKAADHAAELEDKKKELAEEIARQTGIYNSATEAIRKFADTAAELAEEFNRNRQTRTQTEAAGRRTANIERQTGLIDKHNSGHITPDEAGELAGTQADPQQTKALIKQGDEALKRFNLDRRLGQDTTEDLRAIHSILQRVIGLGENQNDTVQNLIANDHQLEARLAAVETNHRNLQSQVSTNRSY